MKKIPAKTLRTKIKEVLLKNGADEFSSESVSKGLVETSLRGVDSHGIRLFPHYLNGLKNGRINGVPNFKVINSSLYVKILTPMLYFILYTIVCYRS